MITSECCAPSVHVLCPKPVPSYMDLIDKYIIDGLMNWKSLNVPTADDGQQEIKYSSDVKSTSFETIKPGVNARYRNR